MTKVAIIDEEGKIWSCVISPMGAEHRRLANKVMKKVLEQSGLSIEEIYCVVATGYSRFNIAFADYQVTELTCHAMGVASLFPNIRTAIDMGGQDAKSLKIDNGKLVNFVMNDKCAAGTGRFLEVIADSLGLKIEDLRDISLEANNRARINSTCTFFAQQDLIFRFSDGMPLEDILAGLHDAIASRVVTTVKRLNVEPDVVLTGDVAKNVGVVKAIREKLECEVFVPADPLLSGAVGAALLAREFTLKRPKRGESVIRKERQLEEATFFT